MRVVLLSALLCFASSAAVGKIPSYGKPEILARANGLDSYNLPPMSFLTNATPTINNKGEVAFRLMAIEGQNTAGLWLKTASEDLGKVVYRGPLDKLMSDPSLNDEGQAVFSIFDEGTSDGIFVYDSRQGTFLHPIPGSGTDLIFHAYPTILNNGDILFRGTHNTGDRSFFRYATNLTKLVSEGDGSSGFKASYLFGPAVNHQQQWAFKIRVGDKNDWAEQNPDQIVLRNSDGQTRIVAQDQNSDPKSPFRAFANSVSLSENGFVAFVATLTDGKQALILDENGVQTQLAVEGHDGISEFELFGVKINSQGLVLFRAKNLQGQRGIYLADSTQVLRLLGEKDEIPTDLGKGRILAPPSYPVFSGGVSLNDRNEISFHALIVSAATGKDWGSAIYKLSPLH